VIYRDDRFALETRIADLSRALRAAAPTRRRVTRARRALTRLRHPIWRLVPRSVCEVVVAIALASGALTLALSLAFMVLLVVTGARAL